MTQLITLAGCVLLIALSAVAAPVHLVDEPPVDIKTIAPGVYLVDFGRVAFGNLRLLPPANAQQEITVHLGEAFAQGRINRKPPGMPWPKSPWPQTSRWLWPLLPMLEILIRPRF